MSTQVDVAVIGMRRGGGQSVGRGAPVPPRRTRHPVVAVRGEVPVDRLLHMVYADAYPTFHRAIDDVLRNLRWRDPPPAERLH